MHILPEAEAFRAQEDLHVRALRTRNWVAILGFLAVAASSAPSRSADYSNRIGLTAGGGAYKFVGGAVDHATIGPFATFGVRLGLSNNFDVEASGRSGYSFDDTKTFRLRASAASMGTVYSFSPDSKFTVQALGGGGIQWWNVLDLRTGDPGIFGSAPTAVGFKEDGNAVPLINSNILVYLGVGVEYAITQKIMLGAQARCDYLFHSETDNTGASDTLGVNHPGATPQQIDAAVTKAKLSVDANDLIPSVWFGVTYWFGERDGDQDGVPNRIDKCVDRPEDKDAFQDEDGCPDEDDDGDGVPDATDKCAREAEDKDGFEDEDGCPDLDNDKDGVPDAQDACGDAAEDKDNFQDTDGCPDFDNDGDAVADSVDQCNDTPAGVPVDEQGCPRGMRIDQSRLLQGIGFKKGTAEFTTTSYATLDSVAAAMRAFPKVDLEVHTSVAPSGQKARDETLSQQRADAVIAYLVQHGADQRRLTGIGFGAAPLAGDGSLTSAAGVDAVAIKPAAALPPVGEPEKPKE